MESHYAIKDVETVLINFNDEFVWKMSTATVMNEDTGLQYLRVTHELDADVFEDDEIIFEVAFQTQSAVEDYNLLTFNQELLDEGVERMGEDAFRCALSINSTDKRFWKATLSDGYYVCNGLAAYDATTSTTIFGEYLDQATADNIC
jgi:hypothetical protein